MQTSLESGNNTMSVIKKICLLDLKTLLDKYKAEIQDLIESRTIISTEIMVNESRLSVIESELAKYASLNQTRQGKYGTNQPSNAFNTNSLNNTTEKLPFLNSNISPNVNVN